MVLWVFLPFFLLPSKRANAQPFSFYVLFLLATATSIDAMAVGLSLSMLNISLIKPVVIIGGVTFLLSFSGIFAGHKFGYFLGNQVERLGGLIMIGIGIKILIGHGL